MALYPNCPLKKDDLRSLLAQTLNPTSEAPRLSPAAVGKATQWARVANLIDERGLTTEGRIVATKDPYLEATVTDWLIHFHLSLQDPSLWNYLVYVFLPNHSSFTQIELFDLCAGIFRAESPDKLKKDIQLVLKTYTDELGLKKSKFLIQNKKIFHIENPDLSNPYTTGYLLAKFWEQRFRAQQTVLVDEVVNTEMGLTYILGITTERFRQELDVLAKREIIDQLSVRPRLAGTRSQPKEEGESTYQILRRWESTSELLEKAYDNDIATPNRPLSQALASILDDGEEIPDFSQFMEWATELIILDGGLNSVLSFAS